MFIISMNIVANFSFLIELILHKMWSAPQHRFGPDGVQCNQIISLDKIQIACCSTSFCGQELPKNSLNLIQKIG